MRNTAIGALCGIATLLVFPGILHAQEDVLIENQRTNIIYNTTWGDTYVGKYTSGNVLDVSSNATLASADAFVGFTDTASSNTVGIADDSTWSVGNLQVGTAGNGANRVFILDGGMLELGKALSIDGATNGNGLVLADGGTLHARSDFDAGLLGFYFTSNGTLKVDGTLSHLDQVEGGRHIVLNGADAAWNRPTNDVVIGQSTSGNSVKLDSGAHLDIDNLFLGSAGTTGNAFVLAGSSTTVASNLVAAGASNQIQVSGSGLLTLDGILASESAIQFDGGGEAIAHGMIDLPGIDGSGSFIAEGANALWTNNGTIAVGAAQGGSTLTVRDHALVRANRIEIGAAGDSEVWLGSGGKLVLEDTGSVLYDGSTLWVEDGGWITFGSGFNDALAWTNASIVWNSGGTFEFQGEAPVIPGWEVLGEYAEMGEFFLGRGRTMILNGPNAYLAAHTNNFHLGDLSSDNTFIVENGANASFKTVSIGDFKEGGNDNLLLVRGNGSVVTNLGFAAIGGTLVGNAWHEGGDRNVLRIEDGAMFYSPGTLHNRNTTGTSGLEIASGATVDVASYYQSAGAYLTVFAAADGTNAGLLRADTATFESGARIGVDAVSRLVIDQMYTNSIVQADALIIGGVTNGATADLAKLGTSGGSLVNFSLSLEDGTNIVATYNRRYLSQSAGFDPETMMAEIADEIDILSMTGNAAASNQIDILNLLDGAQQKTAMEQLYVYQLPTFMHNQGVFGGIDQVRARGSSFHRTTGTPPAPAGAAGPGPHAADQGVQGWVKAYGSFGARDKDKDTGYNDGYDVQAFGTVLGFDRAFGEWLFGLAGGYAGSVIDADNGDESEAGTGYGILYASYGTEDWFGDLVASYGVSDIDNESGGAFDVSSSTEATHTTLYAGGGKEFKDPEGSGALLRPLLGLQVSLFDQDGYTEKSPNAVGKQVDAYDRWSYLSTVGAEMAIPKAGAKIDWEAEFRAYWLHEFNDDEDKIDYTLAGSTQPGQFLVRAPDSDIGQFGVGCVAKWKNGLQLRADLDAQVSKTFYSTTLSGTLLYEF